MALQNRDDELATQRLTESLELARRVHDPQVILVCLTGLATVAARRGRLHTAAHVWGAAERLQRDMGSAPVVTGTIGHEWIDAARKQLGVPAFEAAVTAGAQMSLDELVLLGAQPPLGGDHLPGPPVSDDPPRGDGPSR